MNKLKSVLMIGMVIGALFLNGCGNVGGRGQQLGESGVAGIDKAKEAAKFLADNSTGEIVEQVQGVIIPHHLLVQFYMEKFYQQLAKKLKGEREITRIILISPNHFGYGYNFIQSTDQSDAKNYDVNLDVRAIDELQKKGVLKIEPKFFGKEHGVYTHFPFLKKYFPEAKVVPVILKREIPQEKLDALVRQLTDLASDKQTLVIGSIDFSHYSEEYFSLENDERMVKWLKAMGDCGSLNAVNCPAKDFQDVQELGKSKDVFSKDAVAVDSPECVYVVNSLMRNWGAKNFQLWKRTSSASIIKTIKAADNTSHLFVSYGL